MRQTLTALQLYTMEKEDIITEYLVLKEQHERLITLLEEHSLI